MAKTHQKLLAGVKREQVIHNAVILLYIEFINPLKDVI